MSINLLNLAQKIFFICLIIGGVLTSHKIIYLIFGFFPKQKLKSTEKKGRYALLIPARNESLVIADILSSISKQTYDKNLLTTYVIVESAEDKTCEIAKKFGANVFVREHLQRKGKGYALEEVVNHIYKKNETFDAFFIFDADNVLQPNYIEEMNKAYWEGNDIAVGYRHNKNWNDGVVSSCSALLFGMVNTGANKARSYLGTNILLSGTGFYVSAKVLNDCGGWKFFNLTEDYELSIHALIKNYKSRYVETAEFYDEQPKKLKQALNQRTRWIKGFQKVNFQYMPKLLKSFFSPPSAIWGKIDYILGIIPLIIFIASIGIYGVFLSVSAIVEATLAGILLNSILFRLLMLITCTYGVLAIYTIVILMIEGKRCKLTFLNKIMTILFNPIFMALYIPSAIKAVLSNNIEWKPIEHTVVLNMEDEEEEKKAYEQH